MYKINIIDGQNSIQMNAIKGQLLSDLLRQAIPTFSMPCSGNHTCGKCRVMISDNIEPPNDIENRLLSSAELKNGIRLACTYKISDNITVTLLSNNDKAKILSWSKTPSFEHTEKGYGIAVDIGTTTVAMQLYDRKTGNILSENLKNNAQGSYGADVISRIEACRAYGIDTLSNIIVNQLESMADDCIKKAGINKIDECVVTGNSTMLHIFEGLDPSSLAVAPFDVKSYFGCISAKQLANAPIYLPRCIGAYVGADIVCSILASDMLSGGVQLLADIGTNGEMAIVHGGKLICCSTAAGPAFEGAGLSSGMPSAPGAICSVSLKDGNLTYETIQNKTAIGICGSGVLDLLASMLRSNALDSSGYIETDYIIGDSSVKLIQKDIRQIQLAKSAICAGIMTLLEHEHINSNDISRYIIGGGFGSSINLDSASEIGLFPHSLQSKAEFVGNSSLGGASMLLMNKSLRKESESFASKATEISLSSSGVFMDYYIDCMSFDKF